jgi:energy-converting hydrogenase A subunit M
VRINQRRPIKKEFGLRKDILEFLEELGEAEIEEDNDIYVLMMHLGNAEDLNIFDASEQDEIRRLMSVLLHDSKRHRRLLARISKVVQLHWDRGRHDDDWQASA